MNVTSYGIAIGALFIATSAAAQSLASDPMPLGRVGTWLDVEAAPLKLMKKLEKKSIVIRFTLSVGPDGRAIGCTHDGRKKLAKTFGELTCSQLLRRARFKPAKDAQGSPVNGTYSSIATWCFGNSCTNP